MTKSESFPGSTIKIAPSELIVPSQHSLLEDARQYVQNKLRKFRKGLIKYPVASEEFQMHLFEKSLDFPQYVARKLLRTLGHTFPEGDGKAQVRIMCKEKLGFIYQPIIFAQICTDDHLNMAQSEEVSKKRYESLIKQTEEFVPMAIHLALESLYILREVEYQEN